MVRTYISRHAWAMTCGLCLVGWPSAHIFAQEVPADESASQAEPASGEPEATPTETAEVSTGTAAEDGGAEAQPQTPDGQSAAEPQTALESEPKAEVETKVPESFGDEVSIWGQRSQTRSRSRMSTFRQRS